MLDDPDGHELLSVVPPVHHEGVDETLDDRALGLAKTLGGVTTAGVGSELGVLLLHSDVVLGGRETETFFTTVSRDTGMRV